MVKDKHIIKGRLCEVGFDRIIPYKKERPHERGQYIGVDVHQAMISATFLDSAGKLVTESILETKAVTIPQLIHGVPETGSYAEADETFPGLAQVV